MYKERQKIPGFSYSALPNIWQPVISEGPFSRTRRVFPTVDSKAVLSSSRDVHDDDADEEKGDERKEADESIVDLVGQAKSRGARLPRRRQAR